MNNLVDIFNVIGRTCEWIEEKDPNKRYLETGQKLENDILRYRMMYVKTIMADFLKYFF